MSKGSPLRRGTTSGRSTYPSDAAASLTNFTFDTFHGRPAAMSESVPSGSNSPDNNRSTSAARRNREEHLQWVLQQVRQALTGLKFGQITITVQDGLAIQIERTEKTRLR